VALASSKKKKYFGGVIFCYDDIVNIFLLEFKQESYYDREGSEGEFTIAISQKIC